jgi:hypothetical protein
MSLEGYDAFDNLYAYPGTTVLKNLLDISVIPLPLKG